MATPASSATTPSPPLAYLQPVVDVAAAAAATSANLTPTEQEARQHAVSKIMARAEFSKLTRALRTTLSYANYKATHNVSNLPLRTLESQLTSKKSSFSVHGISHSLNTAKRKAAGGSNYYNNPATQGGNAIAGPSSLNTPQAGAGLSNATHSLFSSILAPPPSKRARTIHSANSESTLESVKKTPKRSSNDVGAKPGRGKPKGTPSNKKGKAPVSSLSRRSNASVRAGSHSSFGTGNGDEESTEVDFKAAATLAGLLLSKPGPSSQPPLSPRSSISTISDIGSTKSFGLSSHIYAQSSTRVPLDGFDVAHDDALHAAGNTTPKTRDSKPKRSSGKRPATADNEAADLMLLLANSPSPIRPTHTHTRDSSITRSAAYAAGRVLFAGSGNNSASTLAKHDLSSAGNSFSTISGDDPIIAGDTTGKPSPPASQPGSSSIFIAADNAPSNSQQSQTSTLSSLTIQSTGIPREPTVTPPTPILEPGIQPLNASLMAAPTVSTTSQLLPPPPSPSIPSSSTFGRNLADPFASPTRKKSSDDVSSVAESSHAMGFPNTPTRTLGFDMNEYINVSPSPGPVPASLRAKPGSNLGIPMSGRKLFDNIDSGVGALSSRSHGVLGGGIDLVKT